MKTVLHTVALLLIFTITGNQHSFARQTKKKKANASLNISSATEDTTRTTYFNIGLFSSIYQLKGIGLNALSSITEKSVHGLQLSGISNITGSTVTGFQLAGITNVNGYKSTGVAVSGLVNITGQTAVGSLLCGGINITGGQSNGLTAAGLVNITGEHSNGMQISGLANITGAASRGVALSGLLNVCAKDLDGVQISSLLNVTAEKTTGVQLSALGNIGVEVSGLQLSALNNTAAEELKGVQLGAVANVAKNVRGVQAGILNYCMGEVKGIQLGIVNYSKDTSTVKIGLVNLNPKTRVQLLAYGGNSSKINIGVRFRNKITYTIAGVGAQYLGLNDKFSATSFYRAGLHFPLLPQLRISGDVGFAHIECFKNKDDNAGIPKRMYSLQARVNLEYQPLKRFGIFASGGYAVTRHYNENKTFEKKPLVELGIVLF